MVWRAQRQELQCALWIGARWRARRYLLVAPLHDDDASALMNMDGLAKARISLVNAVAAAAAWPQAEGVRAYARYGL